MDLRLRAVGATWTLQLEQRRWERRADDGSTGGGDYLAWWVTDTGWLLVLPSDGAPMCDPVRSSAREIDVVEELIEVHQRGHMDVGAWILDLATRQ